MAALLALVSSLMWGVSDFLGGLGSRRVHPIQLTALSYPAGLVVLIPLTLLVPGVLSAEAWWAGAAAGVAGAFGVMLLYVVLAAGPMGVMSPLTAVVAAIVPVGLGLVLGERPAPVAYLGMALAVVAILLVSREPSEPGVDHQQVLPRVLGIALLSGVLMGLYLALIGIAPDDSGIWTVLISRVVSCVVLVSLAILKFRGGAIAMVVLLPAILVGCLDAGANALYRLAAQDGMLTVVAVLAALYPAATVLLARFVLHERLRRLQVIGLVTALAAAALLATA